MLAKARKLKATSGKDNVEFIHSRITKIDLPSSSANCIISNCVINLVPAEEKQLVFDEMFRILKPGGRVAVSDILAKKPLSKEIKENIGMYVGCVAGASQVTEYEQHLEAAGFKGRTHPTKSPAPSKMLIALIPRCPYRWDGQRLERVRRELRRRLLCHRGLL